MDPTGNQEFHHLPTPIVRGRSPGSAAGKYRHSAVPLAPLWAATLLLSMALCGTPANAPRRAPTAGTSLPERDTPSSLSTGRGRSSRVPAPSVQALAARIEEISRRYLG